MLSDMDTVISDMDTVIFGSCRSITLVTQLDKYSSKNILGFLKNDVVT